jgi:hypothetical protein
MRRGLADADVARRRARRSRCFVSLRPGSGWPSRAPAAHLRFTERDAVRTGEAGPSGTIRPCPVSSIDEAESLVGLVRGRGDPPNLKHTKPFSRTAKETPNDPIQST